MKDLAQKFAYNLKCPGCVIFTSIYFISPAFKGLKSRFPQGWFWLNLFCRFRFSTKTCLLSKMSGLRHFYVNFYWTNRPIVYCIVKCKPPFCDIWTCRAPCICDGVSRFYLADIAFSSTSRYGPSSRQCAERVYKSLTSPSTFQHCTEIMGLLWPVLKLKLPNWTIWYRLHDLQSAKPGFLRLHHLVLNICKNVLLLLYLWGG